MRKPILYIMCGIPGCGKTWYATHNMIKDNVTYVSRDTIRYNMLNAEDDYFSKENLVYAVFVKDIRDNLKNGKDVIADATHLNWNSRRKLLNSLGDVSAYNIVPVVVGTDLDTALARNERREGRAHVGRSVIRRMHAQFTDPADDPYTYSSIMRVDNKEN